jgi:hypothetical protein
MLVEVKTARSSGRSAMVVKLEKEMEWIRGLQADR